MKNDKAKPMRVVLLGKDGNERTDDHWGVLRTRNHGKLGFQVDGFATDLDLPRDRKDRIEMHPECRKRIERAR